MHLEEMGEFTRDELKQELVSLRKTISSLANEIKAECKESDYAEDLLDWLLYDPECDIAIIDIKDNSPTEGEIIDSNKILELYLEYKKSLIPDLQKD